MTTQRCGPGSTRDAIATLLASDPKPSVLKARTKVVTDIADQIEWFMDWPALVASLRDDALRLKEYVYREALERQ